MNNPHTETLRNALTELVADSSRINSNQPQKYWYPLAKATYGVEEILEAVDSMVTFRTTMWEKTARFEAEFAAWQGRRHAVMVNSGSSADLLACFALTNKANPLFNPKTDEILIPVVTWPTHIWSAMMAGMKVRFVDIDPDRLNVTAEILKQHITPKTKALFLVHLMGLACDMTAITALAEKYDLIILEDCCEALGAMHGSKKVGNFGLAATFSFFMSHHACTLEGGMVVTDDEDYARTLRIMRAHGWLRNVKPSLGELSGYTELDPRYTFVNWGFNVRPTELQAGFGLHQLKKVDTWNQTRRLLAALFYHRIKTYCKHLRAPSVTPLDAPFALPLLVNRSAPYKRTHLTSYLEQMGVETRPLVTGNVARHPVAKLFPEFTGEFPNADDIHDNGFYVGLSPMAADHEPERVAALIAIFEQNHAPSS